MEKELKYVDMVEQPISMHPKKFALWLFMVTVVMIFAALTSAYIVRQAEGNWLDYELPNIFWVTSGIVVLSSVFLHFAYVSAKKDNISQLRIGMVGAVVLGLAFLVGQWYSWVALVDREVFFVGNPAGSFLYVFTGLHALHLISGVIFLIIVLISTFRYKVHSQSMNTMEMATTYWHFLGGLWIYLFMFLLLNH
ncbi:MAG TPA: cytochrome oxidase subunit III [Algoriphagus sp.]|uniref:cytochrome c oxidase subunit 3 n=1 Tax=unclassified Algoriphagus TaxID=2641541 RepID=UPI000C4C738A|nr:MULTISPECIES: cytochrome c oxidase subunit 3 [unclassified Algoriphagus]MAL13868.1 cytochrome oxidase subunit III [Algoriphagus sp.]MAN87556.1 cytochrome oxidase subunit III [Algoriphagus sp.]QYH41160.1 cytochrome oxidase subunit III [Algoriphagus sp. NBT04N3]HAH36768.1 cytochrome oxidase subunit III [Algoriphagus sp.]HAS60264.1 cytochrome oxidase subunit III [Algoriphagus sp.]